MDDVKHRGKLTTEVMHMCCIARKVPKSEWQNNPDAKAAMDAEWAKLCNIKRLDPNDKRKGVWDEDMVMEEKEVFAKARNRDVKVHVARIAELCTQKNSELPDGSPQKKWKGRADYLGDNVLDETFNWAEFQDLGSNPPDMEAGKALDAVTFQEGYVSKSSDAIGVNDQTCLLSISTGI